MIDCVWAYNYVCMCSYTYSRYMFVLMDVQTSLSSHWRCDVVNAGSCSGSNVACQWEQTGHSRIHTESLHFSASSVANLPNGQTPPWAHWVVKISNNPSWEEKNNCRNICLSFTQGQYSKISFKKSSESRLPWEPLKPGPAWISGHLNGNGQCRQLFKGISLLSFSSSAHIWARLAAQQRHPTGTPRCSGLED